MSEITQQVAGELSLVTLGATPTNVAGIIGADGKPAAPSTLSPDAPMAPLGATVIPIPQRRQGREGGEGAMLETGRAPELEKTGPATILFMVAGAAAGWAGLRRRKKGEEGQ
jgi:hypothetical protein